MQGRKRGGQLGNVNALKHGQRSKRFIAEQRKSRQAEFESRRKSEQEWADAMPKTDYGAICDAIAASASTKH